MVLLGGGVWPGWELSGTLLVRGSAGQGVWAKVRRHPIGRSPVAGRTLGHGSVDAPAVVGGACPGVALSSEINKTQEKSKGRLKAHAKH